MKGETHIPTCFSSTSRLATVTENLEIIEAEAKKLKERLVLRSGSFGSNAKFPALMKLIEI